MEAHEGKRLRDYVRGTGKTQDEFAATLGMTRQNLNVYFLKQEIPLDFKKTLEDNGHLLFSKSIAKKEDTKAIPYLRDIDAIAGINGAVMDVSEYIEEFISVPFFNKADYYVNVRGDSMYGRYRAGDIIAIKQVKDLSEIQYGQVFVVVTDENRVLKYVRKGKDDKTLTLVSENPKFDPYDVERKKVRAMFLVLGKITKDVL